MVNFVSVHDVREAPAQAQFILDFGGLSVSDTVMADSGHNDIFEPQPAEQRQFKFQLESLIEQVELGFMGGRPAILDDHDDEESVLPPAQHTPEPINTMFVVPPPVVRVDNTTYRGHGNGNEDEDEYPVAQQSNTGQHRATSAPQNDTKLPQNKTQDTYDMDGMSKAIDAVARSKTRNARRMTPEETAARKQAARVAKRERQSIVNEADPRRADARRERASRRAASTPSTPGEPKKTYRRRSGTTCSSSSTSAEQLPVLYINTKNRTVSVSPSSPTAAGTVPLPRSATNAHTGPKRSRAEKNAQTSPYPRTRPERKDKKNENADEEDQDKKPRTPLVVAEADFQQACPPRNVVENSPEMEAVTQQFERASFTDAAPATVNNEVPAPASPSWKAPELVEEAFACVEDVVPVHAIYDGAQFTQEYAVAYPSIEDYGLDLTPAPAYAPEVDQLFAAFPELDDEDMLYPLAALDARPTELYSFDFATPSEVEPEPETILEAYHLNLKQRYCVSGPMQHYDRLEYTGRYEEVSMQLPDFTQVLKHIYEPKKCKAKTTTTSRGVRYQPYARRAPVAACAAY
ncbi:hypothetical protein EXIGLDRAFT_698539 [Exidia glandulosa HHB12029]|uniref:Uncharacterized protein n=1 Tax=Exidia glandulosa HHB12029 TaxID=1314781 RepID=A0A165E8F3_EXIGL|nr:hypothetical protein EXIGLDRAFT_698539 [Exidia glandulosa HHB12029]